MFEDGKSVIRSSSVCFLFARMVLLVVVLLQLVVFLLLLRYAAKYSLVGMGYSPVLFVESSCPSFENSTA